VIGSNAVVFSPTGGVRISSKDLAKIMMARMNGGIVMVFALLNDSTARVYAATGLDVQRQQWRYLLRAVSEMGAWDADYNHAPMGDIVVPGKDYGGHAGEAYGLVSDVFLKSTTNSEFFYHKRSERFVRPGGSERLL